ncbi:hypothetical protein NE237_023239 [Protea cynaroides]|uniref:Chitinase n=1 Tax=Protea cynaroides TaxID=273540 RepID=A0A9Q0HCK3_9MAGN|nr:hypothetical protein NE237_023239 [Protea cynaroides]
MDKGILTSNSVGNDGLRKQTTVSVAPWLLSVAASSTNRHIISKPDITAPAVEILAAYSPVTPPSPMITLDKRSVKYSILSGTSMSCPHAAGAAAYVKSFHPDCMVHECHQEPDAEFAYGAGHIDPVKAVDPGLVYVALKNDYIKFLCNIGWKAKRISIISGDNSTSPKSSKGASIDLNYPSMAVHRSPSTAFVINFPRRVTNVGSANSTYKASVISDSKIKISVKPGVLSFTSLHQEKSFVVTVSGSGLPQDSMASASLIGKASPFLRSTATPQLSGDDNRVMVFQLSVMLVRSSDSTHSSFFQAKSRGNEKKRISGGGGRSNSCLSAVLESMGCSSCNSRTLFEVVIVAVLAAALICPNVDGKPKECNKGWECRGSSYCCGLTISDFFEAYQFENLFSKRNSPVAHAAGFWDYQSFILASTLFQPLGFGTTGGKLMQMMEVAAFLGHVGSQTSCGYGVATGGPLAWGLCYNHEMSPSQSYCNTDYLYPCAPGVEYYGRGALPVYWNYNYGFIGDGLKVDLLNHPEYLEQNATLAFEAAMFKWMSRLKKKQPSAHEVFVGDWEPTKNDTLSKRVPGFGATMNLLYGDQVCGQGDIDQMNTIVSHYKYYLDLMGVPGDQAGCANVTCAEQLAFNPSTTTSSSS